MAQVQDVFLGDQGHFRAARVSRNGGAPLGGRGVEKRSLVYAMGFFGSYCGRVCVARATTALLSICLVVPFFRIGQTFVILSYPRAERSKNWQT